MTMWRDVCSMEDLHAGAGICALVDGQQVAIFYVSEIKADAAQSIKVYASGNYDPFGCANVLSRGIVGDINGQIVVSSPLYKHHFDLLTGVCLEDELVKIPVYPVQIHNNRIEIQVGSFSLHKPVVNSLEIA